MSMFKVFDTAASGMSAQSMRLNLVSSNLANVDSISSSIGGTYRARHPVFAAILNQQNPDDPSVGVQVKGIVESQAPLNMEFAPNNPMANEEGYIFRPNVNVVEEMANMISASRTYQSNVEVVNATKQLMSATLRMGE